MTSIQLVPSAIVAAAQKRLPLYVTVEGVRLSYRQVLKLSGLALEGAGVLRTAVKKTAAEMPPGARDVYYDGTDAHGKPIIWISSSLAAAPKLSNVASAEFQREETAAGLLAVLGVGGGGPALQSLYGKVRFDANSRQKLGIELATAIEKMSEKVVKYSTQERRWMFASLTAGMPRSRVAQLLQSRGISATATKVGRGVRSTMLVSLPGAFEPGCYFSRNVTIAFDAAGRLYKMDLSQPIPDCL